MLVTAPNQKQPEHPPRVNGRTDCGSIQLQNASQQRKGVNSSLREPRRHRSEGTRLYALCPAAADVLSVDVTQYITPSGRQSSKVKTITTNTSAVAGSAGGEDVVIKGWYGGVWGVRLQRCSVSSLWW